MGLLYSNYQANPTTNIQVNAVSGTLTKTFRKSFFKRFHMNSETAQHVFNERKPTLRSSTLYYTEPEIVVLQIMLCGDNELLAELIYKEDYDEIFKVKEDTNETSI